MNELKEMALAKLGLLPEKTKAEIVREEEEAYRAIAEGRLNPYEARKKVDEAIKPLVQDEIIKVKPVICYIDENGQIKRRKNK